MKKQAINVFFEYTYKKKDLVWEKYKVLFCEQSFVFTVVVCFIRYNVSNKNTNWGLMAKESTLK